MRGIETSVIYQQITPILASVSIGCVINLNEFTKPDHPVITGCKLSPSRFFL